MNDDLICDWDVITTNTTNQPFNEVLFQFRWLSTRGRSCSIFEDGLTTLSRWQLNFIQASCLIRFDVSNRQILILNVVYLTYQCFSTRKRKKVCIHLFMFYLFWVYIVIPRNVLLLICPSIDSSSSCWPWGLLEIKCHKKSTTKKWNYISSKRCVASNLSSGVQSDQFSSIKL